MPTDKWYYDNFSHPEMKIYPLSEGAFTVDQTRQFVPFSLETDEMTERSKGSLLVEIQPFLIITGEDKILLDTGLGFSDEQGNMQIHTRLESLGVSPGEITLVLMSHLHKDHAGGLLNLEEDATAFPQATYYINKKEWEAGISGDFSSYLPNQFKALEHSGQLKFTHDTGEINRHISYELSGGHSLFHQVFWIRDQETTIFFGGDEAPQLQQMKHRFKAKYDSDGQKAMELRDKWWKEGTEKNWTFLFYHDIKNPTFPV